ncbi:hypothetical protein [Micromonospora sp. NPDC005324]|uniref:hypothetical protein n=1 Tax=Micromonospora sp. NPDC005324 TaxID=3157033 RepID=UPI0033B180D8
MTFGEDASQICTHHTPAAWPSSANIICGTFRLTRWANTASARRAHTTPAAALTLHRIL